MRSFLKKKSAKPSQCQDIDGVDYTHLNISYSYCCKKITKSRKTEETLNMQKFCFRVNLGSKKNMGYNTHILIKELQSRNFTPSKTILQI